MNEGDFSGGSLLWQSFFVGSFVFGGGQVYIPIIEELFVDKWHIASHEQYYSLVSLATAIPGPFGPKLLAYAGYVGGASLWLALASLLAFALPNIFNVLFTLHFYRALRHSRKVQMVMEVGKTMVLLALLRYILKLFTDEFFTSFPAADWRSRIEFAALFLLSWYLISIRKLSPLLPIGIAISYAVVSFLWF